MARFVGDRLGDPVLVAPGLQRREDRLIPSVTLGDQPCLFGEQRVALRQQNLQPGARIGIRQGDKHLTLDHLVTVLHPQLGDHAAIGMLNRLPAPFDLQGARRNGSSRQRGKGAPQDEDREEGRYRGEADERRRAAAEIDAAPGGGERQGAGVGFGHPASLTSQWLRGAVTASSRECGRKPLPAARASPCGPRARTSAHRRPPARCCGESRR
jgi:hypothetical protein